MNLETIKDEISAHLTKSREWLLSQSGKSFALNRDEIELISERGRILFSFQSEKDFQTWRITNYKIDGKKLIFNLSRNFEKEKTKIELVPRTSAGEILQTVELARIEKADKIAALIVKSRPQAKLIRVSLKQENGRLAQIVFENPQGSQIAAFVDVSETISPERLLTTAIIEREKLYRRKKNKVEKIWILGTKTNAEALQKLLAMLKEKFQKEIEIFEISFADSEKKDSFLRLRPSLKLADLWRGKASKIKVAENFSLSETAQKIIAFAPETIDAVFTRHGETLRFHGLPFARIRKFTGKENIWFGVESNRQDLNEKSFDEFSKLIENLELYRSSSSPNKRHTFYTLAPEAWLESILQRNIKRLDANLILSPLHTQFRAGRDKIDLLALRRDGRLIIIELKTSADCEMIYQSLDYWRKIEIERRTGNLQKAKIFGEAEIKNEPALIYLAAPMLSFHREFEFLAKTVAPEIEFYRFDLNENWRETLKVIKRKLANSY